MDTARIIEYLPVGFGALSIVFLLLFIREHHRPKDDQPLAGKLIEEAEEKSQDIIKDATEKATGIVEQSKISKQLFEEEYKKVVDEQLKKSLDEYVKSLKSSQDSYEKFVLNLQDQSSKIEEQIDSYMKDSTTKLLTNFSENLKIIQEKAVAAQQESETSMKSKVSELLLNFEQNLSTFLTNSQQKSVEAISLELKSARQLIDTYKGQQLAIVDENIIAVLERTLNLVMRQKMSLKDQMDLVFESLEKAKTEKFFV
ncbi:MAG: hypothetical protein US86_C0004G0026 [Candidatus Daviesbacteria bacterium GW2011_GWA2_38_24]|uniref:Uncharacterized protein n=1 Tax=Candidatus Daviesbacteria bacterium GW2011_GWA2_38_24 TaxID=1618422 RepID=A0A0G0JG96_9BACT|nr:MAG: hypothetical protein US86_C0004G0026 [Candidatus Daviesbacteria bacterium GW2011_GWA2_38_24]KKQ78818.1 MAG: hypothetical protein UT01_C0059G0003 [Candidatus Daviesbacteria bacterium GW2011_GWA1_38_7]OGE23046.1 MAG: hypothetical protein A2688_03560 [Candidatus Daviesbacteria bacterium RIFCSPHIGHO2_01_FULL_38_8]